MFKFENFKKFCVEASIFFVGFMMLVGCPVIGDTMQHNYSQICEVYEVTENYTTFVDPSGNLWDDTNTDYEVGEMVKIYFHDSFTDFDRTDDIIKKIVKIKG